MKCLVPFILAVVLVATEGKVVPASDVESQQTGTQPLEKTLTDHINAAKNLISSLGAQMQEHMPDQGDILNTMQEHTNNFAKNVNEYLKNVTEEYRRATSST
ncbi:unnamed protein product [Lasius platythorax]|uniref:Apolipophorin-III n=1 Tax=Lasius platythorax TaxID=488582 RepID=A0AAV2NZ09_9HYME